MTESNGKNIIFISHDASRTGAPIILLNFLRWFKKNSELSFRILLRRSGDLENEFRKLTMVNVFGRRNFFNNRIINRIFTISALHNIAKRIYLKLLNKQFLNDNIGLIYSNTITNGEVLKYLSNIDCPVITHVHELEYWINQTGKHNFGLVKQYTDPYIAVSEAVKNNLVQNHEIPVEKVEVIHGFIPISSINIQSRKINDTRKILNIPESSFIVGGSGYENWRKGQDIFIQLAVNVLRKYKDRPVHFVWVGGNQKGQNLYKKQHDIKKAGVGSMVHFVPQVLNPMDYYSIFDVFTMVSREDPFPLVNLEVAVLGKPILCFENAGGTSEFIENDSGFAVPYLDIEAMADKIIMLANDEKLRKQLGKKAAQKAMERHDISIVAPKILEIINRFIQQ